MRKITFLLVAMFAVVGSAFAQIPAAGSEGYLYDTATKKFISGDVEVDGVKHATTGDTGIKFKILYEDKHNWGSYGQAIRFETDMDVPETSSDAGKGKTRLSRSNATNKIVATEYNGWSKWGVKGFSGKGFRICNEYGSGQGNCLSIQEDGRLTLVAEADAPFWHFIPVDVATAKDALIASAPTEEMYPEAKANMQAAIDALNADANADTYAAAQDAIELAKESVEEYKVVLALAAAKPGDDITAIAIKNAGFETGNADGWTVTTNGGNAPSYKNVNGNVGMTKYQGTIKMEQTINNLPAGWYTLKAQAFGRKNDCSTNRTKFEAGEELETPGVIFANGVTKQVPNVFEYLINESEENVFTEETGDNNKGKFDLGTPSVSYFRQVNVDGVTKYILDNSNSGSYVFSLGAYETELIVYVAEGEALNFGFDKNTANDGDYCGCDNFRLIYNGETMPQTFAEGKYYLYNVEAGKYWGAGNSWGTQASLLEHPDFVTLHYTEAGYQMESQVNNGGTQYYFNGSYMDNGSPKSLLIVPFGKFYKIYTADGDVYGYNGTSTVLGNKAEGNAAAWQFFTEDDMKAQLAKATAKEPVDATWMIIDHTFGRNHRNQAAWDNPNGCAITGGNSDKHSAEAYRKPFTITQTIADAPKGTYTLYAQGFYRQDGSDNENLPVFFANDKTETFPLRTGTENSMKDACASFENGLYGIEPIIFTVGDDGEIKVGAKLETNNMLWCIWDNFVLTYYGPDATELEVKAAMAIEDYQKALAAAQKVDQSAIEIESVKTALADALTAYPEETVLAEGATKESIEAATAALAAATDAAEASVIAANILPKMKALTETTNVYTQEAFDAYYTQYYDKYVAGTLTAEEARGLQDPDQTTGWHAAITVDNFLLDAWDTNPDFNNAPYYINSWSTEGDGDGTNFHVPFFEYWTGDANSLGTRTLTATMNDLPAGKYDVSAWVRVRAKNETDAADATGITLQVNEGAPVDVTEGEKVGTSQFNIGQYTASAEVSDDGVLKIMFIVAEDNNISWLSFKNVKFEKVGEPTKIAGITEKAAQKAIFNAAGQQMNSLQKGLNIVNGQKVYVK